MGSALLDTAASVDTSAGVSVSRAATADTLRREVAARLAAHRSRRGPAEPDSESVSPRERPGRPRSARIAAAVAERYAQVPSYHAYLAAEAERAVQQARAAAEVAELNAQALIAAQQNLLDALNAEAAEYEMPVSESSVSQTNGPADSAEPPEPLSLWADLGLPTSAGARSRRFRPPAAAQEKAAAATHPPLHSPAHETGTGATQFTNAALPQSGLTIRLYQDATGATRVTLDPMPSLSAKPLSTHRSSTAHATELRSEDEARALDDEIEFRHAPVFEESVPGMPLPANLIEFPRQLVATRKARPRLAEGPLRDEDQETPGTGQLRIFEVDPAQIATTPEANDPAAAAVAAQWTSIWLESLPESSFSSSTTSSSLSLADPAAPLREGAAPRTSLPGAATVGRRMLAAGINAAVLVAGFAGFLAVFGYLSMHMAGSSASGPLAAGIHAVADRAGLHAALAPAACVLALLYAIYQALFFTFSTATPGMRIARVALCTFSDENPTRLAARRRLLAVLLSACPLGLGFVWAALDDERLTWHDRLCRIYQRSY